MVWSVAAEQASANADTAFGSASEHWPTPRSRARKSADGRIPAENLGLHNQTRRAADCAPYLNSLRLYYEGLEEKFLERGAPAPLLVRLIDDFRVSQSLA